MSLHKGLVATRNKTSANNIIFIAASRLEERQTSIMRRFLEKVTSPDIVGDVATYRADLLSKYRLLNFAKTHQS